MHDEYMLWFSFAKLYWNAKQTLGEMAAAELLKEANCYTQERLSILSKALELIYKHVDGEASQKKKNKEALDLLHKMGS